MEEIPILDSDNGCSMVDFELTSSTKNPYFFLPRKKPRVYSRGSMPNTPSTSLADALSTLDTQTTSAADAIGENTSGTDLNERLGGVRNALSSIIPGLADDQDATLWLKYLERRLNESTEAQDAVQVLGLVRDAHTRLTERVAA